MKAKITFLMALFALSKAGFGQSGSLSLADAIAFAEQNHPSVKVAQIAVADADWRIKESKATGLPQVTAGVSYQGFLQQPALPVEALGFPGNPGDKIRFALRHQISPSISASQLFFSNSYLLAKKAARFYKDYAASQLVSAKQKVRNSVIDAYLPALLIADNVVILDKNVAVLQKITDETRAIFKAGFAEQIDVDRLDFSISNLKSERTNLERQREIVLGALRFQMGMSQNEALEVSDNLEKLMTEYGAFDPKTTVDPSARAEMQEFSKAQQLSQINMDLYKKPFLPTVAGFISYNPGFQGNEKLFFIPSAVAGVEVKFTLYDGGGNKARKERAFLQNETLLAQKKLVEKAIDLEAETARKQWLSATDRIASAQKNVELAQRIADTAQKKFKAGLGSSFELTSAESGLLTAQQTLLSARHELLMARTAFRKAAGL